MSSREKILAAIRANKPEPSPLPELSAFEEAAVADLPAHFAQVLAKVGGQCLTVSGWEEAAATISATYPDAVEVFCQVPTLSLPGSKDARNLTDPHELKGADVAILPGRLAVAENAAVYLAEEDMGHRALPFITQQLVFVVPAGQMVWNMHQAYRQIRPETTGYGVFFSGPSKTADIEQSLVIGAHGTRSLLVLLVQ